MCDCHKGMCIHSTPKKTSKQVVNPEARQYKKRN